MREGVGVGERVVDNRKVVILDEGRKGVDRGGMKDLRDK